MRSFLIIVFFIPLLSRAQRDPNERLLTVGFQLRPVVASRFLDAGEQFASHGDFETTIKPKLGYTFGMLLRRGFTKTISIETGINYIRRNYKVTNVLDSVGAKDIMDFGLVSYEIPIQGLLYVRLGERFYMNNAFGISLNWFASDVGTVGENNRISQLTFIRKVPFNPALLANVGFEYRTEKSGFFYLGASLHRPLNRIATTRVKFDLDSMKYYNFIDLSGSFLTIDFRYFFHEQPVKKKIHKEKKKKNEPSGRK